MQWKLRDRSLLVDSLSFQEARDAKLEQIRAIRAQQGCRSGREPAVVRAGEEN